MFEKKQTGDEEPRDDDKTSMPEKKEAAEERKHGGKMPHHARKHGGKIPGHKAHGRPDKRARGGGADMSPMTSAGNMSESDYTKGKRTNVDEEGAGSGPDRNAKGFA